MNKPKITGAIGLIVYLSVVMWALFTPNIASAEIPLPIAIPTVFIGSFLFCYLLSLVVMGNYTSLISTIRNFFKDGG